MMQVKSKDNMLTSPKHSINVKDPLSIDKYYRNLVTSIQQSIYHEIKFILSCQFGSSLLEDNCILDVVSDVKIVILKTSDLYNYLSKLNLYTIAIEGKKYIISNNNIKSDVSSINKRLDFVKSKLIADINSHSGFKVDKIDHKKMSDEEISSIKKTNITKTDVQKKLLEYIKSIKLSSFI